MIKNILKRVFTSKNVLPILLTLAVCLFFFSAKSQPMPGNGCKSRTSPTRVYQVAIPSYGGLPTYKGYGGVQYSEWTVQYDITTYPCVTWTTTSTRGCYIRIGTGSDDYVRGDYGYFSGNFTTNCPIDDSILLLFIPVGLVAVYHVKRTRDEEGS